MTGPAAAGPVLTRLDYRAALDGIGAQLGDPVLHIGARAQVIDRGAPGRRTWADRCAGRRLIGADLEPGEHVDAVLDICWPPERIAEALAPTGAARFGGILCCHLLEHLRDPFAAARTISDLLAPGGLLFVQVPWVQGYHAFPDDYWRISLSGLMLLFGNLVPRDVFFSGASGDVAWRIETEGKADFSPALRDAEGTLFQVVLEQEDNRRLLAGQPKRVYLSRAYMPVMVVNFLAQKPPG